MPRTIEVVDYDPDWIAAFDREAALLASVFERRLLEIHHIGSTAVPDLPAKPIIDMLVVLADTDDMNAFSPGMEALGYRVRGECLDAVIPGTPGRFYFTKDTNGVRSHHVHACAKGHQEICDKLAFRDYLRSHGQPAAAYGDLKRRTAIAHRLDNIGYMHTKDAFVKSTLADARRWYKRQGERAGLSHRLATNADLIELQALMAAAIRTFISVYLDAAHVDASFEIMGIDTQLIDDGTYFVVECEGRLAGCGGWSRRATLFGGDHSAGRDARLLDPAAEPARVRAMYTHPDFGRRGVGRLVLSLCEAAAAHEGFRSLELVATVAGEPLYSACGFAVIERIDVPTSKGVAVPCARMTKSLRA